MSHIYCVYEIRILPGIFHQQYCFMTFLAHGFLMIITVLEGGVKPLAAGHSIAALG